MAEPSKPSRASAAPPASGSSDRDPIAAIAALAEPTRRRIYQFVASVRGPVGRDEAAERLGIGRPLAAFHLDRLVASGLLVTEYRRLGERRGRGGGRPAKLYRRPPDALTVSLPARHYDLAAGLFAEALESAPPAATASAATAGAVTASALTAAEAPRSLLEAARQRGAAAGLAAAPEGVGDRSGADLREALLAGLARAGYEPELDGAADRILLRNCPFDDLAREHRGMTCPMNLAFLEGFRDGLIRTATGPAAAAAAGARLPSPAPVDLPGYCCVAFEPRAG